MDPSHFHSGLCAIGHPITTWIYISTFICNTGKTFSGNSRKKSLKTFSKYLTGKKKFYCRASDIPYTTHSLQIFNILRMMLLQIATVSFHKPLISFNKGYFLLNILLFLQRSFPLERQMGRYTKRNCLSSICWFTSQMPATARLGQTKESWKSHSGL